MKPILPDEFLQSLGYDTCPANLDATRSIDGDFWTTLGELLHIAMLCDEGGATVFTSETLSFRLEPAGTNSPGPYTS